VVRKSLVPIELPKLSGFGFLLLRSDTGSAKKSNLTNATIAHVVPRTPPQIVFFSFSDGPGDSDTSM
jgi:hypothetical protein